MSEYINILKDPVNHKLSALFKELRWGRPAAQQKFLTLLADKVDGSSVEGPGLIDLIEGLEKENQDPANWWKTENETDESR